MEAIKLNPSSACYVTEKYMTFELWSEAIKRNGILLSNIPMENRNLELCLEYIKARGSIHNVHEKYYSFEFFMEAVKINTYILQHIPKEYITYELCIEAVRNKPYGNIL